MNTPAQFRQHVLATPDVIEPVVGYRYWSRGMTKSRSYPPHFNSLGPAGNPLGLYSVYRGLEWHADENEAECWRGGAGLVRTRDCGGAPSQACRCGFYAVNHSSRAIEDVGMLNRYFVVGAIKAWGRLILHQRGFRAQYVAPLALIRTRTEDAVIAEHYELKLVRKPDQLEEYALQHGRPIGDLVTA